MYNKRQGGFTLVELVIVIAILSILAAVAIPMFTDLRAQARTARLSAVAASFSSASAINYASCLVTGGGATAVTTCGALSPMVTGLGTVAVVADVGSATAGSYNLLSSQALTNGASGTCTLVDPQGNSTSFIAIGASSCS